MRLISKNIFSTFLFCAFCFAAGGYVYEILPNGYELEDPKALFFNLNPRLDRMIYWLTIETSVCLLFIVMANEIQKKSWINFEQRLMCHIVGAYYFAELISSWCVQLFMAGKSFNDIWLAVICVLFFGIKSYHDERAHNWKKRRGANGSN